MEQTPRNETTEKAPISSSKKVLRPWTLAHMKALAAAGLVGVAGMTATDNADAQYAQQYTYSNATYPGVNQKSVQINTPSGFVQFNNINGRTSVNAAIVINPEHRFVPEVPPDALQMLHRLGYEYKGPGSDIYCVDHPDNGKRLHIGPRTTRLLMRAGMSGSHPAVFIDMEFSDNNRQLQRQKFIISSDHTGVIRPIQIGGVQTN